MLFYITTSRLALYLIVDSKSYVVDPNSLNYAISLNQISKNHLFLKNEIDYKARLKMIKGAIEYLNVENSLRYLSRGSLTFCNVYAHDLCHLLGVYLPRIWWRDNYLKEINFDSSSISLEYGVTIFEQTCNMLFKWLNEFGQNYGWVKGKNIEVVQLEVNKGTIGLAVAKNIDFSKNGHISVIIPLDSNFYYCNSLLLLTEAGLKNRAYSDAKWWEKNNNLETEFWFYSSILDR